MNMDMVKGKIHELKADLKMQWAKLTDDDFKAIEAGQDDLYGRVQYRYGLERDQAKKDVDSFTDMLQEKFEKLSKKF